jgi:hypothetical protein
LEHHLKCPTKCDHNRYFSEHDLKEHIKNECHVVQNQRKEHHLGADSEIHAKIIDCQQRFEEIREEFEERLHAIEGEHNFTD